MSEVCQSCGNGPRRHFTGAPDKLWICTRCLDARHGVHELLTIDEAARRLKVSTKTVRRLIKAGKLPAFHITPRTVRVRADHVEGLTDERKRVSETDRTETSGRDESEEPRTRLASGY